MAPTTTIVRMTPAKAAEMLKMNKGNRPLTGARVRRFAKEMREGRWMLNGAAIVQNCDGTVIDGQHRLYGCIEAGKSFQTVLVTGIDKTARATIDIGAKRSLADVMYWEGFQTNHKVLAAATSWAMRYEDGLLDGKWSVDRLAAIEWLKANPDFPNIVNRVCEFRGGLKHGITPTIAAGVTYSAKGYESEVLEFFERYANFDFDDEPALYVLRRWVDNHNTGRQRPPATVYAAVAVKAVNAYLTGGMTDNGRLKYEAREDFPTVLTKV